MTAPGEEMMSGQTDPAPQLCYDIPRLLQLFESLGENCDLGVVQRAVGLEPFGLFRFAACDAAGVAALLRARFHPLGEPEDLWLDEVGPRREYWVKSRRFSFEAHTNRYADQDNPEVARMAQIEKTRFLRERLIRDLSRGRRLFVFKGTADIATVEDIAAQLQAYGPNCLLWVKLADTAHLAGTVVRLSPHLLSGFISRIGTYEGDPSLPVEEWISVCANAYRLWRGADPPKVPVDNLISRATVTRSCRWFAHPSAANRALNERTGASGIMLEHGLGTAETTPVYGAHLPITQGGNFVFSAWIRIPEPFRGRQLAALLCGFSSISMWPADLKAREHWQRVWVSANIPIDARSISCAILAEGPIGDIFYSARWCLERGNRPMGYGFAL
jgi:hypothetical protein